MLPHADESVQMLHKGGLSAAGVPDDSEKFPLLHGQGNVFQRVHGEFGFRAVCVIQSLRNNSHNSSESSSAVSAAPFAGTPFSRSFCAI